MKTQVLKPGYLVSLKTTVRGGVNYTRRDITDMTVAQMATDAGMAVSAWETVRTIPDPAEYAAAGIARSKARSLVTAVCCPSSFGLLCPENDMVRLEDAIEAARAIADAHNRTAARSHVDVFVLCGRIAHDSAEAARALSSEMRDLLDAMKSGIAAANPEAIREAANKARALDGMLSDDVQASVTDAIAQARKAARDIVRRVEKAGETAAAVVAECNVALIERARFAFLDMDPARAVTPEAPAAAGLDLEPAAPANAAPALNVPQFEMEGI